MPHPCTHCCVVAATSEWDVGASEVPWQARSGSASLATGGGALVMIGGFGTADNLADVWVSHDGASTWVEATRVAAFGPRHGAAAFVVAGSTVVVAGGFNGSFLSDVWISQNVTNGTFVKATSSVPWAARSFAAACTVPCDGGECLLLSGGVGSGGELHDVWRSKDGGHGWELASAESPWHTRQQHHMVSAQHGRVVLLGGATMVDGAQEWLQDVWLSTDAGSSWKPTNYRTPWSGSAVCAGWHAHSEALIVVSTAGSSFGTVWHSGDVGVTWVQVGMPRLNIARLAPNVVLVNGAVVMLGGNGTHGSRVAAWAFERSPAAWAAGDCSLRKRAVCAAPRGAVAVTVAIDDSARGVVPANTAAPEAASLVFVAPAPRLYRAATQPLVSASNVLDLLLSFSIPVTGVSADALRVYSDQNATFSVSVSGSGKEYEVQVVVNTDVDALCAVLAVSGSCQVTMTVSVELPAGSGSISPRNAAADHIVAVTYLPPMVSLELSAGADPIEGDLEFDIALSQPVSGLQVGAFAVDVAPGAEVEAATLFAANQRFFDDFLDSSSLESHYRIPAQVTFVDGALHIPPSGYLATRMSFTGTTTVTIRARSISMDGAPSIGLRIFGDPTTPSLDNYKTGYIVRLYSTRLRVWQGMGGWNTWSELPVNMSEWHVITLTYGAGNLVAGLDGVNLIQASLSKYPAQGTVEVIRPGTTTEVDWLEIVHHVPTDAFEGEASEFSLHVGVRPTDKVNSALPAGTGYAVAATFQFGSAGAQPQPLGWNAFATAEYLPPTPTLDVPAVSTVTSDATVTVGIAWSSSVAYFQVSDIELASALTVVGALAGSGSAYELTISVVDTGPCVDASGCDIRVTIPANSGAIWPDNDASVAAVVIRHDHIAPVAAFTPVPDPWVTSNSLQVYLGCSEPGCMFTFSLNNAPFQPVAAVVGTGTGSSDDVLSTFDIEVALMEHPPLLGPNVGARLVFALLPGHSTRVTAPAPVAAANTSVFIVNLDGSPDQFVHGSSYELPHFGPGFHSLAVRLASESQTSAVTTWLEWFAQNPSDPVVVAEAAIRVLRKPAWGGCLPSQASHIPASAGFMAVASCDSHSQHACYVQFRWQVAHAVPGAATCPEVAWSSGLPTSLLQAPWPVFADIERCGAISAVVLRPRDGAGRVGSEVVLNVSAYEPVPSVVVTRAPRAVTTALRARSTRQWLVEWAAVPGPYSYQDNNVAVEYRWGNGTEWSMPWTRGGVDVTAVGELHGVVAVPLQDEHELLAHPSGVPGANQTLELRLVALSACAPAVDDVLLNVKTGPTTVVRWHVSATQAAAIPRPVIFWHPLPVVEALTASSEAFRWSTGPECPYCSAEYRVLVLGAAGERTVAVDWVLVNHSSTTLSMSADIPRSVLGLPVHGGTLSAQFEVRSLAPITAGGKPAWEIGPVAHIKWKLTGLPSLDELQLTTLHSSLPPPLPGHLPVVLPSERVSFAWAVDRSVPAATSHGSPAFVVWTLCLHSSNGVEHLEFPALFGGEPAPLPLCASNETSLPHSDQWFSLPSVTIPPMPAGATLSLAARVKDVRGWYGPTSQWTWRVSDADVVFSLAPLPVTPLATVQFHLEVVDDSLAYRLRSSPWAMWFEYRLRLASSAVDLADEQPWTRAPADDALSVGPLPVEVEFRLEARVRSVACVDCWQTNSSVATHGESGNRWGAGDVYIGPVSSHSWLVEQSDSSVLSLSQLPQGLQTLRVVAQDPAGNVQAVPSAASFTVDSLAPNVSVWLADPDPAFAGTVVDDVLLEWLPSPLPGGTAVDNAFATNADRVVWVVQALDRVDAGTQESAAVVEPCVACTVWHVVFGPYERATQIPEALPQLRLGGAVNEWQPLPQGDASAVASAAIPCNASGWYSVAFAASDAAGNVQALESAAPRRWFIDRTAPQLTFFEVGGPSTVGATPTVLNTSTVGLLLGCAHDDTVDFVVVALDEGGLFDEVHIQPQAFDTVSDVEALDWLATAVDSPTPAMVGMGALHGLSHGTYNLVAHAVDALGNESPLLHAVVVVDLVPPSTATPVFESTPTNASEAVVTFTVGSPAEPLRGFHVTTEAPTGNSWRRFVPVDSTLVTAHATIANLSAGVYTVSAVAEDVAGNMANGAVHAVLYVDHAAPTSALVSAPPPVFSVRSPQFVVSANEVGCTFRMAVVDAVGTSWQSLATAPVESVMANVTVGGTLPDGNATASIGATDPAGNMERDSMTSWTWIVDGTAPEIVLHAPAIVAGQFTAVLEWDAEFTCIDITDCKFDVDIDGNRVLGLPPMLFTVSAPYEGPHTLTVSAKDLAGNQANDAAVHWTVDTTVPWLAYSVWVVPSSTVTSPEWAATLASVDSVAAAGLTPLVDAVAVNASGSPVPHDVMVVAAVCSDASGSECSVSGRLQFEPPKSRAACGDADEVLQHPAPEAALIRDSFTYFVPLPTAHPSVSTLVLASPQPDHARVSAGQAGTLVDGFYVLSLRTTDEAGNTRQHDVTFEVDTEPPAKPTVATNLPESRVTAATSAGFTIVLVRDSSPQILHMRVMYLLDSPPGAAGQEMPAEYVTYDVDTGTVTVDFAVGNTAASLTNGEKLSDGGHRLMVWFVDGAGNSGTRADERWTVLSQGPCTQLLSAPAARSGHSVAQFVFRAVQPIVSGGNCTTTDDTALAPVPNATFQVQLAPPEWITVCAPNAPGVYYPPSANDQLGRCEYGQLLPGVDRTYLMAIRAVNSLGTPSSEPQTHTWRYEDCNVGFYAALNSSTGALLCLECPPGADCPGGLLEQRMVQPESGWWSDATSPDALEFYRCPIEEACLGRTATDNGTIAPAGCADGYTGRLCALCDEGYFLQFGKCSACPESQEGVWVMTVGLSIAAIFVLGALYLVRSVLPIDVIGIAVTFAQVRSLARV